MKKHGLKCLFLFVFLFLAGIQFSYTTSEADCFYQKSVHCYKDTGSFYPTEGTYDVWVRSTGTTALATAISQAKAGSTIYVHGINTNNSQIFISKSINIRGVTGLTWVDTTYYYNDYRGNSRKTDVHHGVNPTLCTSIDSPYLPQICMKGTTERFTGSGKNTGGYQNVYGASLVIQKGQIVIISGLKFSGMCGSSNNACSLITVLGGCDLNNVWIADNNWYTYPGKTACAVTTAASEQKDGIGNPGGGLTVYGAGAKCSVGNLKVSNCHGYFQGGGIHVGKEAYLYNWTTNVTIEITNCSASSGGGLAAVTGGKIDIWGSGTVNIHDNYVEDAAYNAYNPYSNNGIGFTAGNVHVASGSSFRFGAAGGSFKIYNGGKESAYAYAHAGNADVGNIAVKGDFLTDHDTYIYNGLGSYASEVIVTGKWTYGHNNTTTTVGQSNNYCYSEVYRAYNEFSGVKKDYGNNVTECSLILNQNGKIVGELDSSTLNINASIGDNGSGTLPWHIIWNKKENSELIYHGTITRDPNNLSYNGVKRAPGLHALYNQENAEAEFKNASIDSNTGLVENYLGKITSSGSCTYMNGMTTKKDAETFLYGDTYFASSKLINYGYTKIGSQLYGYKPKIESVRIYNYSGSGKTYPNEQSQGINYRNYYTSHLNEGTLVFDNNTTESCYLYVYGGYTCLQNAGQYNGSIISIYGGSLHLDGDNVALTYSSTRDSSININGEYANLHITRCKYNYKGFVKNIKGRVDVDGSAILSNKINSQDVVDISGSSNSIDTINNCGSGKVYHRYGVVYNVNNGVSTSVDDVSSGERSKVSEYYQYNGAIGTTAFQTTYQNESVTNYATYHVGDADCNNYCSAYIYRPVTNYGIMSIGSEGNTKFSYIGLNSMGYERHPFINYGEVYNNRGKLYISRFSNVGQNAYFFNSSEDITKDYGTDIYASEDIEINSSTFQSYGGTISAKIFNNFFGGKSLIRGTKLNCEKIYNEEDTTLSIKNPIATGQTTSWTGMITNLGTLNFSSEVTDGEKLTIDAGKFENQNKLELNIGDSLKHATLKVTGISPNDPQGKNFYNGSDHSLDVGPAVDFDCKFWNKGTLTFKKGNLWDVNNGVNSARTDIKQKFENSKTVTSQYGAKVYFKNVVMNNPDSTFTMNGETGSSLDGSITNSGTMHLRKSMEYSESDCFAGTIVNNASLTLGDVGDADNAASTFSVYNPRPDFDANGNTNYALRTEGGTTTVARGVFTGSNNYPIYVEDSQFIIDDDSHNVINGKKITVNLDDTNGTWMDGKVPVLDNSSITKYQMNFEKNKRTTDALAGGLKIPMTTISNASKLSNWKTFVTASTKDEPICENTAGQERYDLYTHTEREAVPDDDTVYLYLKDITPPTISTSLQEKYVEVDCRYGSHSTQYVPVTLTDDISGIKSIVIEMTNEDRKKAGLDNYYEKKTINLDNVLEYKITKEDLLSFHNDDKPITFGNLEVVITATDASGNKKSITSKVMAGRIKVEIYDKFEDSKKQSGNANTYWNFVSDDGSEDKFVENIGSWLAGDQKWLKVTLEGFWDSTSLSLENTQGTVDLSAKNPSGFTISKNGYKTINGAVNGKETAITVPLKAKYKDLDYIGVLTTKKKYETTEGESKTDQKTFNFTFSSNKKKSIENSIEKRILSQSTQREDGSYYDGFHVYHD